MEASDDSSGSTEMTETAPSETMSIAALMAREGVKSDSERTDFNPVHVNRDGTWETKREDVDSSVAPTTEETDSEETQRESSQSFEEEDVPTTQKEEGAYEYQEWQDAVKVQRPEEVLKVLGFDDKTTSFEICPKTTKSLETKRRPRLSISTTFTPAVKRRIKSLFFFTKRFSLLIFAIIKFHSCIGYNSKHG